MGKWSNKEFALAFSFPWCSTAEGSPYVFPPIFDLLGKKKLAGGAEVYEQKVRIIL